MTGAPVSRANAPHYLWGEHCDGWHLLEGQDLHVIEEEMPPGTCETRHYHHKARQFFYVLSGQLTIDVSDTAHPLDPGQGLAVAPGTPHIAANRGNFPVRFLVISAPTTRGDRHDLVSQA